jgi:uncharacterized protein (TIGR02996 family)
MTPGNALLQAILAEPEDDMPRLVYADWLEEYGRTEADLARAELIRVECRAARLPVANKRRQQLEARAIELERVHLDEWTGPLRAHLGQVKPCFVRGFPRYVSVTLAEFARPPFQEMAAEWFPRAGVMELYLRNPSGTWNPARFFPSVPAAPFLAGLHTLALHELKPGDEGLKLLADCPGVANLRTLELDLPHCSDAGLRSLAGSPFLQGLRVLRLGKSCWGDKPVTVAGLRALLAEGRLPHLTTLRLPESAWSLQGRQGEEFRELTGLTRLRTLDLSGNLINDEGAGMLAGCAHLANLTELVLVHSRIRDRGALALVESPHLTHLQRLDLRASRRLQPATVERLRERFGDGLRYSNPHP